MKKAIVAVLAMMMCIALSACGQKDGNVVTGYKAGDVTLGQYKGLNFIKLTHAVSSADVQAEIDKELEADRNLAAVDGKTVVEKGDVVDVDYECFVDGEPFEKGKGTKTDLVIGSEANTFFTGFDTALIGKEIGQFSIEVTFPTTYYLYPELAGKTATFNVNLKSINAYSIPELSDAWVEEHTNGEQKTIDEYKAKIASELLADLEGNADAEKRQQILKQLFANSTVNKDISKEIYEYKELLIAQLDQVASVYGTNPEIYFQYSNGLDSEYFDEYMEAQAKINLWYNYIRSAIVEAEKIEATEAEAAELAETSYANYGCASKEEFYDYIKEHYGVDGKQYLIEQVKLNKATDLIFDSAEEIVTQQ